MAEFNPWEPVSETTIRSLTGKPANAKKMTGSRLGAVLGVNKWKSPFEAWCEIMRVAEQPFEGNKFTDAGNALEPALVEWCRTEVSPYIVDPATWFKTSKKLYDHFPGDPIFGGQWDALVLDKAFDKGGSAVGLIEAKTSSRPQDWVDGVPLSYAVQGLMYADLMGVERVFFPVVFLEPGDYDDPASVELTDKNTFLYELNTTTWKIDRPGWGMEIGIGELLGEAQTWYRHHVEGNISPEFDRKRDKDILKVLTNKDVRGAAEHGDLEKLAKAVSEKEAQLALLKERSGILTAESEIKVLKSALKSAMLPLFGTNDESVSAVGWRVTKSVSAVVDEEALRRDNLFEKYSVTKESFRLTKEKANV